MKKRIIITICIIIIFSLSLIIYNLYKQYIQCFNNSIYVMTKDEYKDKKRYYEIGTNQESRKTKKFVSDKIIIYELKNCYDSYNIKVSNKLTMDNCKIYNDNEIVEMPDEFYDIIKKTSKIEHAIMTSKIMIVDNNYFVQVSLNVNLWTPYELYRYNQKTKKLSLIYAFNNEDVIGIKIK